MQNIVKNALCELLEGEVIAEDGFDPAKHHRDARGRFVDMYKPEGMGVPTSTAKATKEEIERIDTLEVTNARKMPNKPKREGGSKFVTLPNGRQVDAAYAKRFYTGKDGKLQNTRNSAFLEEITGNGAISEKMEDVLNRLFGGEDVSDAEIEATPEWTAAMAKEKKILKRLKNKYGVEKTDEIQSQAREDWRNELVKAALSDKIRKYAPIADGEAGRLETNEGLAEGEEYPVERGRQVFVVIGLPAAGKSTTYANPMAKEHKARLCDSDAIKKALPEFSNGYGGNLVHDESTALNERILAKAVENGDNIVYPILGYKPDKLKGVLKAFKENGYTTNLCFKDMPAHMAKGRLLMRYLNNGRYLPLRCISKAAGKVKDSFDAVKEYADNYKM